jgi:uncharacterized membrane protein (DUF485 family)
MAYIPRFLADPVPGTGTSLWILLIVCPLLIAIVLTGIFALTSGGNRRHDDSQ